jgi:hypothetical protein
MKIENSDQMKCVRCGATAILEGSLMEGSSGGDVLFYSKQTSYLKRMFSAGTRKIKSYAGLHCSHLELMVEFTEADRKKYQEFEGPQPGVLDRIG